MAEDGASAVHTLIVPKTRGGDDARPNEPKRSASHGSSRSVSSKLAERIQKIEQQEAIKPTTQLPTPVEVDDFGLPVRRPVQVNWPPKEEHSPVKGSEKAQEQANDKKDTNIPAKTAETSPVAEPPAIQSAQIQDSDDETFEDARTAPATGQASPIPKLDIEEPPAETSEVTEVADDAIREAESQEAALTVDPKAHIKHGAEITETGVVESPVAETVVEKVSKEAPAGAKDSEAGAEETKEVGETKADDSRTDTATAEKGDKRASIRSNATRQTRASTLGSTGANGVSEFSHQQVMSEAVEETPDDDGGWQTMPSYAKYDIYDDDDKLVAKEHDVEEDEKFTYAGTGGAGRGYTRVIVDDDAQSATSMDDNTQYLFDKVGGTSILDDEQQRDAVSQMQATKDLLTEGQRIAYVGLTRIELSGLLKSTEIAHANKAIKKQETLATESIKMWSQKIMIRLYSHMDISPAEQIMVEQLAEHGVVSSDLTPQLMLNARVKNPMADDKSDMDGLGDFASPRPSHSRQLSADSTREGDSSPPPAYEAHPDAESPGVRTPSQLPSSEKLDIDLRWTVLCDLFLVLIADSIYDARSRVLLERVAKALEITWVDICRFERKVTEALEMQQQAERENWDEGEHMENRRKMALKRKYVMMGLATVGGGIVIGLSAGLLAPVIGAGLAAGFTTIGVTGTSSFLAGAGGAAIITSGAATTGSIIGGRAAKRRMGSVKTFEYRPLHNNKRVNLIVTVSGWMTGKVDDVRLPYSTVDPVMGDLYSVLWEPEMLTSMGDTINILATEALTQGLQQVLGSTILVGLMAALQLPVVLTKLSYLIDNPWAVSLDRAWSAGQIMADSLIERNLGTRPITLVGYSLGSRVIFSCLLELAKRGAFGIIQDVYIFGSPMVVKADEWLKIRTVVAGRFVNGYNRNDWILGYLFRLTNGGIRRIAGLAPVEGVAGMENIDLTDVVIGHMDYRTQMPRLLRECGWVVESDEFTEIEDPDPENHSARQRELINEIEEARKEIEQASAAKKPKGAFGGIFSRRKKAQKAEWEVYEDNGMPKDGPALTNGHSGHDSDAGPATPTGTAHGVMFDTKDVEAELGMGEFQVKELESTLPPMKIPSPVLHSPRDSLSRTRSAEVNGHHNSANDGAVQSKDDPATSNAETKRPELKTTQTLPNMSIADPWADPDEEDFGKEKEIEMTFA